MFAEADGSEGLETDSFSGMLAEDDGSEGLETDSRRHCR